MNAPSRRSLSRQRPIPPSKPRSPAASQAAPKLGFAPDLVHAQDWHTCPAPSEQPPHDDQDAAECEGADPEDPQIPRGRVPARVDVADVREPALDAVRVLVAVREDLDEGEAEDREGRRHGGE